MPVKIPYQELEETEENKEEQTTKITTETEEDAESRQEINHAGKLKSQQTDLTGDVLPVQKTVKVSVITKYESAYYGVSFTETEMEDIFTMSTGSMKTLIVKKMKPVAKFFSSNIGQIYQEEIDRLYDAIMSDMKTRNGLKK